MAQPLPIAACTLDSPGAAEQARRYARLGAAAADIRRAGSRLEVDFGPDVDLVLADETVAVERDCCSFFEIEWEPERRRLSFEVQFAGQAAALDAIAEALRPE